MCTRFIWSSEGEPGNGLVLVGRSMDWFEPTRTVLAARPRGVERQSAPGDPGGFTWTSTYGSVVSLMYGRIAVDGVNESGVHCSGLYLAESDYGPRDPERPGLLLSSAVQYLLDSFASVSAAVAWLESSNVQIIPMDIGTRPGTGHLSMADPTGDSAIVEFVAGGLRIHHGPQYTVMANSPVYDEQLVLLRRYAGLGGEEPLPGGTDSQDRFARAAYYSAHLPATSSAVEATAEVFSVIRNTSTPFGTVDEARPNISTTRWRTVTDLTTRRYFFEWTMSPSVLWVDLDGLTFDTDRDLTVEVETESLLAGDITAALNAA